MFGRRKLSKHLIPWHEVIAPRLSDIPLFKGLAPRAFEDITPHIEWITLPGGRTLLTEGEVGDALYLVATGALGVLVSDDDGRQEIITKIAAGDTVGEMSLITGEPRSATLVALRDTELFRIAEDAFDVLKGKHPQILENLLGIVARRLAETTHQEDAVHKVKNICIIPAAASVPCTELVDQIEEELQRRGSAAFLCRDERRGESSDWFRQIEKNHDFVLYHAHSRADAWTRLCLRQADRIFLLIGKTAQSHKSRLTQLLLNRYRNQIELVFLQDDKAAMPHTRKRWLDEFRSRYHHHVRIGNKGDIRRLSRHITGRAVGLVLGGGGARGFAHLGVIRALREKDIHFDLVGGTSMGAIVAAGIGCEWQDDELEERMREAFVKMDPLNDYTVPRIALIRGRKVTALLRDTFGERSIEDLWRHFFCVSSDLTAGKTAVHRRGELWRALRASVAIPGILPPVARDGHVLVDGAVMNNFPADIMAEFGRGPIVGIDVEGNHTVTADRSGTENTTWRTMDTLKPTDPGIINVLMRAGTVNSEAQSKQSRRHVDIYFAPPVDNIGIRDWTAFDQAIETGYEHAQGVIDRVPRLFDF